MSVERKSSNLLSQKFLNNPSPQKGHQGSISNSKHPKFSKNYSQKNSTGVEQKTQKSNKNTSQPKAPKGTSSELPQLDGNLPNCKLKEQLRKILEGTPLHYDNDGNPNCNEKSYLKDGSHVYPKAVFRYKIQEDKLSSMLGKQFDNFSQKKEDLGAQFSEVTDDYYNEFLQKGIQRIFDFLKIMENKGKPRTNPELYFDIGSQTLGEVKLSVIPKFGEKIDRYTVKKLEDIEALAKKELNKSMRFHFIGKSLSNEEFRAKHGIAYLEWNQGGWIGFKEGSREKRLTELLKKGTTKTLEEAKKMLLNEMSGQILKVRELFGTACVGIPFQINCTKVYNFPSQLPDTEKAKAQERSNLENELLEEVDEIGWNLRRELLSDETFCAQHGFGDLEWNKGIQFKEESLAQKLKEFLKDKTKTLAEAKKALLDEMLEKITKCKAILGGKFFHFNTNDWFYFKNDELLPKFDAVDKLAFKKLLSDETFCAQHGFGDLEWSEESLEWSEESDDYKINFKEESLKKKVEGKGKEKAEDILSDEMSKQILKLRDFFGPETDSYCHYLKPNFWSSGLRTKNSNNNSVYHFPPKISTEEEKNKAKEELKKRLTRTVGKILNEVSSETPSTEKRSFRSAFGARFSKFWGENFGWKSGVLSLLTGGLYLIGFGLASLSVSLYAGLKREEGKSVESLS